MSGEEWFPALLEIGRPQLVPRIRLLDADLSDCEFFFYSADGSNHTRNNARWYKIRRQVVVRHRRLRALVRGRVLVGVGRIGPSPDLHP